MMGSAPNVFADASGQPLPEHIQDVLRALWPRLRRFFPTIEDDAVLANVMEQAGARIAQAERRLGTIEELHGYAWVTVRRVAVSHVRLGAAVQAARERRGAQRLASLAGRMWTAEAIEQEVLYREMLSTLTAHERQLLVWKQAGFTSAEIGEWLRLTASAVDMQYSRVRAKMRTALQIAPSGRFSVRKRDDR